MLGDQQTSLADALGILAMPRHAGTQAPAEPTVCPKTLLGSPGRRWGGSCCPHPASGHKPSGPTAPLTCYRDLLAWLTGGRLSHTSPLSRRFRANGCGSSRGEAFLATTKLPAGAELGAELSVLPSSSWLHRRDVCLVPQPPVCHMYTAIACACHPPLLEDLLPATRKKMPVKPSQGWKSHGEQATGHLADTPPLPP